MSIPEIKNSIRNIADFPQKGIQFKDITTALKESAVFHEILDIFADHYKNEKIDYIAGLDARGFIFGGALAYLLNCGFVPVRKAGKLPAEVLSQEYDLEYGTDKIEIHKDAIAAGKRVLIIDDLIATGGTALAAAQLVQKAGAIVAGFAFMIELSDLHGTDKLKNIAPIFSLITY